MPPASDPRLSDSPAGRVPGWAIAPAVLGVLLVLVPVASMAARVDWPGLPALLTSESSVTALLLSLRTALASTVRGSSVDGHEQCHGQLGKDVGQQRLAAGDLATGQEAPEPALGKEEAVFVPAPSFLECR